MEKITSRKFLIVIVLIFGLIGISFGLRALQVGWLRPKAEPISPVGLGTPTPLRAKPEKTFGTLMEEEKPSSILDYARFVEAYGTSNPEFDFNQDGVVDGQDFVIFKERYGK